MSASRLIRWSGLAAILGAAFIVLARVIQVVLFGESQLSLQAGSDASVLGLGVPGIIGSLGFLLGLIGLYACQAEAAGRFGLLAFLAAFVGVCLSLGANWTYAFASPFIRSLSPEILDIEFTDAIWGALGTSLGVSYLWGAAGCC